jgi:hypothetical protein
MKFRLLYIFSIFFFLNGFSQQKYFVKDATGVELHWGDSLEIIKLLGEDVRIKLLHEKYISACIRIGNTALKKYPKWVPEKHLDKIYFLDSLEVNGIPYGATYVKDCIFIIYDPEADSVFAEQFIHHEFSSILLNKYYNRFNEGKWEKTNQNKFDYLDGGGPEAIQEKLTSKYSLTLFKRGFIMEYATASVEEDFNCMAESLFACYDHFWPNVEKYRRLRKKLKQTISFYNFIDPVFTKKYFQKISGDSK